jgi:hypothetical protein
MIKNDNDRYFRLFHQLRNSAKAAILTAPNTRGYHLPDFEICEGTNDVTLKKTDYGRNCVVYDVGKLFEKDEGADPSDNDWKGLLQAVISAWSVAEAGVIHPDILNRKTGCAKGKLKQLRRWTYVRATRRYPPDGDEPGKAASETDLLWASKPFEF